ncbi:MAG: ABC transporter ATP-binding protein/permease [Clostridia bacterium]|nr:ABC transporter ATP-binding protein/permease [Clostridia bacterium]
MLQIKNILKQYTTGDMVQNALDGVSLNFRNSEFVAILGQSGSGKTTLLNIIGGLDHYTDGDLIINGVSTKKYKDRDWDSYRNHTIGFVFQSYNLIPHQSVLANVELALTISGVSRRERKRRAKEALEKVGLGEHINKKPNQLSGGQMQRVAIARALVNDPDILLADEPTGALDSETSVQVMDLLKEVANDRLVIMVTHNPELAEEYATRIVKLKDGKIIDDSNEFIVEEQDEKEPSQKRETEKTTMSFFTALLLSLNNLRTKKGRTLLTAFGGSIGIIGIALILSLSTGIDTFVNDLQKDTLTSYPISIVEEQSPIMSILSTSSGTTTEQEKAEREENTVYSDPRLNKMFNAMFVGSEEKNNMTAFKAYLDKQMNPETATNNLAQHIQLIQYQYDVPINTYALGSDGKYHPTDLMKQFLSTDSSDESIANSMFATMSQSMMTSSTELWAEMLPGKNGELISEIIYEQYDLVYGNWPTKADEVLLILDQNNEIADSAFYALGLISDDEVEEMFRAVLSGEALEIADRSISFEDVLKVSFKLVPESSFYTKGLNGIWSHVGESSDTANMIISAGQDINIVGIIRPNPDANATSLSGVFAYTSALTQFVINETNNSEIVKEQKDPKNENYDVTTGLPFILTEEMQLTDAEKAVKAKEYFATLDFASKADIYEKILSTPSEEYLNQMTDTYMQYFSTREAIVSVIASAYGLDTETATQYLAGYTDEELQQMLRENLKKIITDKYAEQAALKIAQIKNSVSNPSDLFGTQGIVALANAFDAMIANTTDEAVLAGYYNAYLPSTISGSTLSETLRTLGVADISNPSTINIYPNTFEDKEVIDGYIQQYNDSVNEDDKIVYTDIVAMLMSGVTTIVDVVSYGLIAFVSISLVVSSIMIGIITYISVLERTKEIGVLRAIGASKGNISSVFNAETLIVGFCSGLIGILVSALLCIPINWILEFLMGTNAINATLPPVAAAILVAISMVLTLIAGLIPSRLAAKKDPVAALRTE